MICLRAIALKGAKPERVLSDAERTNYSVWITPRFKLEGELWGRADHSIRGEIDRAPVAFAGIAVKERQAEALETIEGKKFGEFSRREANPIALKSRSRWGAKVVKMRERTLPP